MLNFNENYIPNKICSGRATKVSCVKISNTGSPKAVIAVESVITDIGVAHNSSAYIFEDIVYRNTSKFDLVICKIE